MDRDRQMKRALALYTAYKTDTMEYRSLAEALGLNTAQLNTTLRPIYHARKSERARKRLASK